MGGGGDSVDGPRTPTASSETFAHGGAVGRPCRGGTAPPPPLPPPPTRDQPLGGKNGDREAEGGGWWWWGGDTPASRGGNPTQLGWVA